MIYLLDSIRKIIQDWFTSRSGKVEKYGNDVCTRVTKLLGGIAHSTDKLVIQPVFGDQFRVVVGNSSYMINLDQRACDCGYFQSELIPCIHVVAAIR